MAEIRSVHILISGMVQGVGFRAWTRDKALMLGLSGWVRNTAAGDVEAHFSGPPERVATMLALCKDGPRFAEVEAVEVLEDAPPAASGPFTITGDR